MRMAALRLLGGLMGAAVLASAAQAAPRCENTADFGQWVAQFKKDAVAQGISPRVVAAASPELVFDESVIRRDSGQGVFQRTFLDFSNRLLGGKRIPNGIAKIQENAALFARIEKAYGVPPEVIAAVWGLESDYGALFGKFKILPSLATLAYDCRRGDHFRTELMDALRIIQRGDRRIDQMTGNWAGEFGGMQFTPSNYIKYGVDFDGDGHIDLTDSVADTLASAANYLKSIGWKRGEPWLEEVKVPADMPWQEADMDIHHPRSEWIKWGVEGAHKPLPNDGKPASLILPMGRLGPAFLAYENFKVFVDWNSSYIYATTVAYFATRLGGAPAVDQSGAKVVKSLTTEQMMELQTLLRRHGHDVGEVDGRLGSGTRNAVEKMQLRYGLPADSWPTEDLIAKLRDDKSAAVPQEPKPARRDLHAPPPAPPSIVAPLTPPPAGPAPYVAPSVATKPTIKKKEAAIPPPPRASHPAPVKDVTVRVLTTRGCLILTMPVSRLREYRRC